MRRHISQTKQFKMNNTYRPGATGALLDEYERAIADLQQTISDIANDELTGIMDNTTMDDNCISIQTILSHVVNSGYAYAIYIRRLIGSRADYPNIVLHPTINDYQKDIDNFFAFTSATFKNIRDNQLEELDNSKKIVTSWNQVYDIEQITEHAIVHVLRHRRQIESMTDIFKY